MAKALVIVSLLALFYGHAESIGEPIGTLLGTDEVIIGDQVVHPEAERESDVIDGVISSGNPFSGSVEDPSVFIPAQPVILQTGWCCGTGPYNVTTVERYIGYKTLTSRASRSVVHTAVDLPCPSGWYPNRPTEADCYIYRQQYYVKSREVTQHHHKRVTRELPCEDDVHVCCADFIAYNGSCITKRECRYNNWMNQVQGLPELDCSGSDSE